MPLELTTTGLSIQGIDEIVSELNEDFIEVYGLVTAPVEDEVFGQLIGIQAEREALVQSRLLSVIDSFDARFATGTSLDRVANYTATTRKPATKSKSSSFLAQGIAATVLADGLRYQLLQTQDVWVIADGPFTITSTGAISITSVTDNLGIARFNFTPGPTLAINQEVTISGYVTNTDYNVTGIVTVTGAGFFEISSIAFGTGEAGGSFESSSAVVTAEAEETGPNSFLATPATEWSILTSTAGWSTIFATADLDPEDTGSDVENDPDFRKRRKDSLLKDGNDLEAMRVSVGDVIGVTSVSTFENTDCTQTVDGIPPGQFEVVVDGGTNTDIAQAIYDDKPPGAIGNGTESVPITSSSGQTVDIKFNRPTDVDIDVQITVSTVGAEFSFPSNGIKLITTDFLAAANAVATIARDQMPESFVGIVFGAVKTDDDQDTITSAVVEMRVGADPFAVTPIPIDIRERADYDTLNVTVIVVT